MTGDSHKTKRAQNQGSAQMGDAMNDRFLHGLKKQLNKLMEENHRWMTLLLTQKSEKQITIFTTHFGRYHCCLSSLTVFSRCLLLGQGRRTEEMFAKWIFNMQLGTLTKNLSKTVVSHLLLIYQATKKVQEKA